MQMDILHLNIIIQMIAVHKQPQCTPKQLFETWCVVVYTAHPGENANDFLINEPGAIVTSIEVGGVERRVSIYSDNDGKQYMKIEIRSSRDVFILITLSSTVFQTEHIMETLESLEVHNS